MHAYDQLRELEADRFVERRSMRLVIEHSEWRR